MSIATGFPAKRTGRRRYSGRTCCRCVSAIRCAAPLLILTSVAVLGPEFAKAVETPPNIILILVDDQGWNGTSVPMDPNIPDSRSDFYQTPTLESLAAAGMRFSNAYGAAPVCSPTRASIITGKSPAQLQMTDVGWGGDITSPRFQGSYNGLPLTPPLPLTGLPAEQVTIGQRLKQSHPNFVTALFGKWHLGSEPTERGFDVFEDPLSADPDVDPRAVFSLTDRANAFMADRVNAGESFFVEVAHRAVHTPIQARPETIAKYENLEPGDRHKDPKYAAMTEDLDTSVGMLLQQVQDLGIEDNTYIIYTSDQGAALSLSSNAPLFRGKSTLWEGGIRVPLVVKGPGIEAGSISDVPVISTDLFNTISELAGVAEPLPDGNEGASLVPILRNGGKLPLGTASLERQYAENGELFFHFPHNMGIGLGDRVRPMSAVRDGDFKLVKVYGENGQSDKLYLFNLADNLTESRDLDASVNLADEMPAKTADLHAKLDGWLQAVDASLAYDVSENVQLLWNAGQPGMDLNAWRSTVDVDYKARETWTLNESAERPQLVTAASHQPGLPTQVFRFDGNDGMTRKFFHVSDALPPRDTVDPAQPDNDASTAIELWVRLNGLDHEQVLFESGDGDNGLSVTLGDADSDGRFNDIRLRAIGDDGKNITVTSKLDSFSNPTRDFVQVVAVFSDDGSDRYAEIYVNGASINRTDGVAGSDEHIRWDGWDQAGLGRPAGNGTGADDGVGNAPFAGGNLDGELALVRFFNYALDETSVRANYNAMLHDVDLGVLGTSGSLRVPSERPTDLGEGITEQDDTILVLQERNDVLDDVLDVDILPSAGGIYGADGLVEGTAGTLLAGTRFSSYLLHFDPLGDPAAEQIASGTVTFQRPIQGILIDQISLENTDAELGVIGRYAIGPRALDLAGSDAVSLSDDLRTIAVSLAALGDEVVQMRILTALFSLLSGDMDFDGNVDFDDIDEYVLGLSDEVAYQAAFGPLPSINGDTDGDGDLDLDDIPGFVQILVDGGIVERELQNVPEPPTFVLLVAGVLLTGRTVQRRHAQNRRY
ncbi:MAG: sulfatase-like hydrolase/transferase [Pirellulaceae bacterium]